MIPLSFSFLKSQPTVGELSKVVKEAQSPIKLQSEITRGDKFVARCGNNQYHQVNQNGFLELKPSKHSFTSDDSLMPQTSDLLSQININNIKNTETFKGDVIRSMGIEVL